MVLSGQAPPNFSAAGENLHAPHSGDSFMDLQPSLSSDDVAWMDEHLQLTTGTPCFQDLLNVGEQFEPIVSESKGGGETDFEQQQPIQRLIPSFEESSQQQESVGLEEHLVPKMWAVSPLWPSEQALMTVGVLATSEVCPSLTTSSHVPSNVLSDDDTSVSMYKPMVPLTVEAMDTDQPASFLLARETCSPIPMTSPRHPSTPASLIDMPYSNQESGPILSAEYKVVLQPQRTTEVKALLQEKITQKRKSQGLDMPDNNEAKQPNNKMTPADIDRYERRKASNRKAATKLRLKNKEASDRLTQNVIALQKENADLEEQIRGLKAEVTRLNTNIESHKLHCRWDPDNHC